MLVRMQLCGLNPLLVTRVTLYQSLALCMHGSIQRKYSAQLLSILQDNRYPPFKTDNFLCTSVIVLHDKLELLTGMPAVVCDTG